MFYPDMKQGYCWMRELIGNGTPLEQLIRWALTDPSITDSNNPSIPPADGGTWKYRGDEEHWRETTAYLMTLIIAACEQMQVIHHEQSYDKLRSLLDELFDHEFEDDYGEEKDNNSIFAGSYESIPERNPTTYFGQGNGDALGLANCYFDETPKSWGEKLHEMDPKNF